MEINTIILIALTLLLVSVIVLLFFFIRKMSNDSHYTHNFFEELMYRTGRTDKYSNEQNEEQRYLMNKLSSNIESFMSFQNKFQSYLEEDKMNARTLDKLQMRIQNYFEESKSSSYDQREFIHTLKNLEDKFMIINHQFEDKFNKILHQDTSETTPLLLAKIEKLNYQLDSHIEKTQELIINKKDNSTEDEYINEFAKKMSSEFSHSIKTPLSSVNSALSNISKKILPIIQSDKSLIEDSEILVSFLENAKISIEYIYKILERGAGFLPSKVEEFKLDDAIRKAIRITREGTGFNPKIDLKLAEIKEFKLNWFSVFISLIQVLENAFEAIKEKKDGFIEIKTEYDESENNVKIIITNNGEIINAKIFEKIFLANYTTKGNGRGLGLSVAKRNLNDISGDIILLKSDKSGTSFEICFPINN